MNAAARNGGNGNQKNSGQNPGRPQIPLQTFRISGAVALPQTDAETAGNALHKQQNQGDNRAGCTYGRQCVGTQRTADNNGICQRIQQLKQIAAHYREGEEKYGPKGGTNSQIFFQDN